jgi:thiamine biosynthesis lipoprotein
MIETAPAVLRREGRAMGSPLRLQVPVAQSERVVDAAWAAVVDEFEATEQALSRFRESSEIHQLRLACGRAVSPSRRLVAALAAADRARRVTNGRFEPRVLLDLERLGFAPIAVANHPSSRPDLVGERIVRRHGRRGPIEVPAPVDFGGIGKGLALRWAGAKATARLDGSPFLLEAGGDIVARGAPGPDGWRIGIEDPRPTESRPPEGHSAVIELPLGGGAIATSSVRRGRWLTPDGQPAHHLIDPATGEPGGEGLLAVTVHGPDPAWAEVWSKALFLTGASHIASGARARGLAAWWVRANGDLEMTPAARERTIWVAGED